MLDDKTSISSKEDNQSSGVALVSGKDLHNITTNPEE